MKEGEPIKETHTEENQTENVKELLQKYAYSVNIIARSIIKKLPSNIELKDLINAGMGGLYKAINNYDPSKNVQLKTYAEFRIRGAILDFLRSQDLVSYRRHIKEKLGEIEPLKFISLQEALEKELPHSEEGGDPFINVSAKENAEKIFYAVETLSPREKMIIDLYYYKGLSRKEIGLKLGISKDRVSQIHAKILKKLNKKLKNFKEQLQ